MATVTDTAARACPGEGSRRSAGLASTTTTTARVPIDLPTRRRASTASTPTPTSATRQYPFTPAASMTMRQIKAGGPCQFAGFGKPARTTYAA